MDTHLPAYPATPAAASPIVELRQYALEPGRRDELIDLFEGRFVAPLEASGQRLHGEFRDANDPDKFVWLRGYATMEERARSLTQFYGGAVWKANSGAANATMVDVSNVLLLKPVDGQGFSLAKKMTALLVATIHLLKSPVDEGFLRFFHERAEPALAAAGAPSVAKLATLDEPNNFPRLPVRTGEHAFVTFAAFGSADEYRLHREVLARSKAWKDAETEMAPRLASPPTRLELAATGRSLKRNGTQFRYSKEVTGDVHDFDFLDGRWEMVNRRLVKRGVGSSEWDIFPASVRAYVLMGGVTNVDEVTFPTKGWSGTTFRHFDLEKRQWSIYWVNTRTGKMDSPVVGGFDGDIGLFYGDDVDEGRPVRVVYKWTRVGPDGARWEQAFSYDDGKTWETNWVNEHRRVR